MIFFVALFVFLMSVAGLFYMVSKKVLLLLTLPSENSSGGQNIKVGVKERLKNLKVLRFLFAPEVFLQLLLSKIQVLALRLEKKTSEWLISLRKKSRDGKKRFSREYWDQMKKDKLPK